VSPKLAAIPAGAEVDLDLGIRFLDHAGYEALASWKATHEKLGGKARMEGLDQIWARSRQGRRTRVEAAPELVPAEAGA
jgi:carbonic anhydrase